MKRLLLLPALLLALTAAHAAPLQLRQADRIVFVGNTFAERLVDFGYFETLLASRFPEHKLSFRNLGWSADTVIGVVSDREVEQNLRPLNFADQMTLLHEQKPDVIFACYGMVESFAGANGLAAFEQALTKWIALQLSMDYSGKGAPRIVLVSPIAHEQLGGHLPDPAAHNEQLAAYTTAMKRAADAHSGKGVSFLDLFTPSRQLMTSTGGQKLTINGIHLNAYGHWAVAQTMMEGLGLTSEPPRVEATAEGSLPVRFQVAQNTLPPPPPPRGAAPGAELLKGAPLVTVKGLQPGQYILSAAGQQVATGSDADWAKGVRLLTGPGHLQAARALALVDEKNQWFFYKYHAVNGEYIYGRRAKPFGVVNFPVEMEQLEQLVAKKDQEIWSLLTPSSAETFELTAAPAP